MILKASIFVIGLVIGAVNSASVDCNPEQCAKPLKLYEELGCKAVFGSKSCCAKRFECPDFKKLDDNKCTFEGQEYKVGDILPRDFTDTTKCTETCVCTREENEPAKFSCTKNDCGVSSFKAPGCINIYGDLDECCSTSIVCDEDEKTSLASCFVGKEYREGEKFIPKTNPCYECLCHKDFDNTTIADNPYCRKLNCEIDLRYKSFVQRGCLPVFQSEKCCPVDWECPKPVKKIVKRAAEDDDATQAPKHDIFVVTPSKNLEEYLDIVKLANASDDKQSSESDVSIPVKDSTDDAPTPSTTPIVVTTHVPVSIIDSETTKATTLGLVSNINSDPFIPPAHASSAESTSDSFKIPPLSTTVASGESSAATTPVVPTPPQVSDVTPPVASDSTTLAATSESTTVTTTESTTTTTTAKDDSDEEEGESKNLFGEEVEEEDDATEVPVTEQPQESSSVSLNETAAAPSTTENSKEEELKVLSQPEVLSTLIQVSTTLTPSSELPVTTATPAVPSTEKISRDLAPEIILVTAPATAETVTPASESLSTSTATLSAEEWGVKIEAVTAPPTAPQPVLTETFKATSDPLPPSPVTETSSPVTVEATTQAATTIPTLSDKVVPTVFEELLTTLQKFVAKIEKSTTTPEPPKLIVLPEDPQPVRQVEFVNFTVSTQNDEHKTVVKRSVSAVDLIPRYFKQTYSTNKDKSCVFDSTTFKIGEVIKTDNDCIKCICEYAPIGHCVLREKCNF